jgi:PAS domain S-box-containing protein
MKVRWIGESWSTSTAIRVLVGGLIALDLLVIALAGWTLQQARRHYVAQAEAATHNLSQVLEQNLQGTVEQIDLGLRAVKDEFERKDLPEGKKQVAGHLFAQVSRIRILNGIRTTDAQGTINLGTSVPADKPINLADRDYFQQLKNHPEAGLVISRPNIGRVTGVWGIHLARRLNHADGSFAGIVYGTITLDRLSQIYGQVDVGPHGSISLRGEDLSLLVRFPASPSGDKLLGDRTVTGDYLAAVRANQPVTHFTARSILDGSVRTYTLRQMANPTFYILIGLSQEDYLQAWRKEALLAVTTLVGLVGLSLGIGYMARSTVQRQVRNNAQLEAQESKYRLLAENATDVIWSMDPEGHLTYISPSLTRQRGWTPEEFIDPNFGDRVLSKENASRIRERMALARQLPPGSQPFEQDLLEAPVRHKDGHELIVEAQWRIVWGEAGQILGFQGVSRDITERKKVEAERDALIQNLKTALAEVRALEGMLPICGHCKKIRDDGGYWNQLETYISAHTDATFTHGICPDCAEAMRREMRERKDKPDLG